MVHAAEGAWGWHPARTEFAEVVRKGYRDLLPRLGIQDDSKTGEL